MSHFQAGRPQCSAIHRVSRGSNSSSPIGPCNSRFLRASLTFLFLPSFRREFLPDSMRTGNQTLLPGFYSSEMAAAVARHCKLSSLAPAEKFIAGQASATSQFVDCLYFIRQGLMKRFIAFAGKQDQEFPFVCDREQNVPSPDLLDPQKWIAPVITSFFRARGNGSAVTANGSPRHESFPPGAGSINGRLIRPAANSLVPAAAMTGASPEN